MTMISYAQNFEDVMLWRALNHVEKGFYIDIGAQHPIVDSVSFAFYQNGWRGVHVEPTPQYANKLRAARPDEVIFQVAIGDGTDLTFYEFPETGISTADSQIAEAHIQKGFKCNKINVQFITMDDLFSKIDAPEVHWLKMDIEGYEENALKTWKTLTIKPWILVIESTLPLTTTENHESWEPLVLEKGYKYVYFDGLNRYYLSLDHQELSKFFLSPPNVFDKFIRSLNSESSLSNNNEDPALLRQDKLILQKKVEKLRLELENTQARFAKLQETVAKLRARLEVKSPRPPEHKQDNKIAEAELARVKAELQAVYSSTSWKITKPIRWLKNLFSAQNAKGSD